MFSFLANSWQKLSVDSIKTSGLVDLSAWESSPVLLICLHEMAQLLGLFSMDWSACLIVYRFFSCVSGGSVDQSFLDIHNSYVDKFEIGGCWIDQSQRVGSVERFRLIDSNAKCRYLKNLTCKGTLRQVFYLFEARPILWSHTSTLTSFCIRV